jgi:hypothetical protein
MDRSAVMTKSGRAVTTCSRPLFRQVRQSVTVRSGRFGSGLWSIRSSSGSDEAPCCRRNISRDCQVIRCRHLHDFQAALEGGGTLRELPPPISRADVPPMMHAKRNRAKVSLIFHDFLPRLMRARTGAGCQPRRSLWGAGPLVVPCLRWD